MARLILVLIAPLMLVGNIYAWIRYAWCCVFNTKKAWRIAIGYDQLANVATNGHEDETISSRAARAKDNGKKWGCILCRLLDFVDENHCDESRGY